jgi:GMP synthase (glutamine-hydrolysing)
VDAVVEKTGHGWVVPVHSVGVQGDARSYAPVLCIGSLDQAWATELINSIRGINRVVALVQTKTPLEKMAVHRACITPDRIARLREADAIVRRHSRESGFERAVWQFPVILIPFGEPDSIVLRPVDSVDGMTARSVVMPDDLMHSISQELLALEGISAVFYDLTHKPPATIEWE